MMSFAERFAILSGLRSPLCLGLDPSETVLEQWGLAQSSAGVRAFCDKVLEAAGELVSVIKPQAGFFERFGPEGMAELARATGRIRGQGSLCLLDAKRGDVLGTMEGYAPGLVGEEGFAADAVTLNAYLGFDALAPVFERARRIGAGVFVVVRSSNPDGRALQDAVHPDGRSVSERLADQVTAHNGELSGEDVGPLGAVIGATIEAESVAILDRLPRALILAPGVGAQGARMEDVAVRFQAARGRVLPSVSRSILMQGPGRSALRDAIRRYRDEAWAVCGEPGRARG